MESYINRKNELKADNIKFSLITDGNCWRNKNKSQLIKAFKHLYIMNYKMAKNNELEKRIKEVFKL